MRFDEKVVFITGGAIGLGRAAARAFAAEGAAAVIADIDDAQAADTADSLRASGGRALAVHCDVADETQVEAAVAEACGRLGGIDLLLNNDVVASILYLCSDERA